MARLYEALERAEQDVQGLTKVPQGKRDVTSELPSAVRKKLIPVYQRVIKDVESECRAVCLVGMGGSETTAIYLREFALLVAEECGKRVLLLEIPEEGSSLNRPFGVHCKATLLEVLSDQKELEEAIHTTIRRGLSLAWIAADGGAARAAMSHHDFEVLLEKLRLEFDFILFGVTSTMDQSEAATLAAKSDGAVLIVESGKTRWHVAKRLCESIEASGGRVLGAVLNNRRHYIPEFIYRWL